MGQANSTIPTLPQEIVRQIYDELYALPPLAPFSLQEPNPPPFSRMLPTLPSLCNTSRWLNETIAPLLFIRLEINFDQPEDRLAALYERFKEGGALAETVKEIQIYGKQSVYFTDAGASEADVLRPILAKMTGVRYASLEVIRWQMEDYAQVLSKLSNLSELSRLDLICELSSPPGKLLLPLLASLTHLGIFGTSFDQPLQVIHWDSTDLPQLRNISYFDHQPVLGVKLAAVAPHLKELSYRGASAEDLQDYIQSLPELERLSSSLHSSDLKASTFAGATTDDIKSLPILEVDVLWMNKIADLKTTVQNLKEALLGSSRRIDRLQIRLHFPHRLNAKDRRAILFATRKQISRHSTQVEIEGCDVEL